MMMHELTRSLVQTVRQWLQVACLHLFVLLQRWETRALRREAQAGQSMVEYALIAALIAIVVMVAVQLLGTTIAGVFERIAGKLAGVG